MHTRGSTFILYTQKELQDFNLDKPKSLLYNYKNAVVYNG